MTRRLRALPLATLLTLAPALVGAPVARADEAPRSSADVASVPCRDLLLITVRGSGDAKPEGDVLPAFREHVLARYPGSASAVWLDYPAVSTRTLTEAAIGGYLFDGASPDSAYFDSVDQGARELTRVLAHSRSACPAQKVAVLAYSQGAQVTTNTLATSPDAGIVSASLLIGNPAHYPGQNVRELDGQVATPAMGMQSAMDYMVEREHQAGASTRDAKVQLVLRETLALNAGSVPAADVGAVLRDSRNVIPADAYATTLSVCADGDMVCDFVPALSRLMTGGTMSDEADRTRPIHGGYTPLRAERSLSLLSTMLRQPRVSASPSPTAGAPTAPIPTPARPATWQPWAAGAALLGGGLAMGFLIGRRRRVSGRS